LLHRVIPERRETSGERGDAYRYAHVVLDAEVILRVRIAPNPTAAICPGPSSILLPLSRGMILRHERVPASLAVLLLYPRQQRISICSTPALDSLPYRSLRQHRTNQNRRAEPRRDSAEGLVRPSPEGVRTWTAPWRTIGLLVIEEFEISRGPYDPAAPGRHQEQHALPGICFGGSRWFQCCHHEPGRVNPLEWQKALLYRRTMWSL